VDSAVKRNRCIEADCQALSKRVKKRLGWGLEAEAFSRCQVQAHGDVLDVFVGQIVEIG